MLPKDVNELLAAMHDREPLEVAMRRGKSATPERLAFIPENISGQTLVLWSKHFAPNLQPNYVAKAQPPYYVVDEQTESVLELSLSALTMWEGRPALTQGRIYGVFENKQGEFEKRYERIVSYIRRHWRKNPALSGWAVMLVQPQGGGYLLPNPPVRNDWIQRLSEQHPHGC